LSYKTDSLPFFQAIARPSPLDSKDLISLHNLSKVQPRGYIGECAIGQQKQDGYIKQLTSKFDMLTVDMLATLNKMLESQIAQ